MKIRRGLVSLLALLCTVPLAADDTADDAVDDAADVTHLTDLSSDRKPRHTVVPVYPRRAQQDRIEGDVEVCFNVDRKGRTSRIAVRRSSHRLFEKPAMQAVRQSTYFALPANVRLSGIKTCRTFRFRLDPVAITDPDDPSAGLDP